MHVIVSTLKDQVVILALFCLYTIFTYYCRQTPLHLAVLNNHEGAVLAIIEHKRLIEKGDSPANDRSNVSLVPNLNLKNSEGDTPVSLALTEGCYVVILKFCFKYIYIYITRP